METVVEQPCEVQSIHQLAEELIAIVGFDSDPVTKFECGVIRCS
ncbi:hypothetical protein [Amycolatopsis lexingtonensis]